MSSIRKRPDGKWRARYRDEAGREHASHFARKVDAQKWLDRVTAAVVRGDYVDPRAGRVKVSDFAREWESRRVASEGTKRIVDNALRLHIVPTLGEYPIGSVRHSQVEALVKELETKGLSGGSVRNIYEVCARVFAAAVRDRVISATPCFDVKLPAASRSEVVPPTLEEVQAVHDALDARWRPIIVVLAGSGLRIGELFGLTVFDVDWLRKSIVVERQRLQDGTISLTKTGSRRTVPVGQVVMDALTRHLTDHPGDGPLFVDEFGEPLTYRRWKRLLNDATTTAGVDMTSHDLRHYCASVALSGGASLVQVQKMLGHKSATITLRTYAHLVPGDDDRTRNALDAALSRADFLRTEAAPNA